MYKELWVNHLKVLPTWFQTLGKIGPENKTYSTLPWSPLVCPYSLIWVRVDSFSRKKTSKAVVLHPPPVKLAVWLRNRVRLGLFFFLRTFKQKFFFVVLVWIWNSKWQVRMLLPIWPTFKVREISMRSPGNEDKQVVLQSLIDLRARVKWRQIQLIVFFLC